MKGRIYIAIALLVGLGAIATLYWINRPIQSSEFVVKYGITPYQDSALPVVAERKEWYAEQNLRVQLVPLSWGDVMSALSSGSIDVAVYNFNSFLPAYEQASQRSRKPLFYVPLYVFKGQAIMVHGNAGLRLVPQAGKSVSALDLIGVISQLRGKRIAVTKGTELEQIVVAALTKAGMTTRDVTLIYASPEDSLASFLSGDIDAFAAGLTERVESRRHGAVELLTEADVMAPVTDGLVTTEDFAAKHRDVLDKLRDDWFRTIGYIKSDVPKNSQEIRDYLRTTASTRYTPEEYAIAWTFNIFPDNPADARKMFNDRSSPYYWQKSWNEVSDFLASHKLSKERPSYSAYMGEKALAQ